MAKRRRVRTDGSPRLDRPHIDGKKAENWYIVWSTGGRSQRRSTGTADRELAQQRLTRWLAAQARPKDAVTVNAVVDAYIESLRHKGAKTIPSIESALRPVRAHFGPLPPDEVTPAYVRKYATERRAQPRRAGAKEGSVSDRAISIELAYLRAALRFGEFEEMIARAPKIKLMKNAGIRRRKRFLTEDEIARLVAATNDPATDPHLRLIVTLALMTAQRGVAIRALKWEHVDWRAGVIWFSRTDPDPAANKSRQDIPLTESLRHVLERARKVARTPWVIEWRDGPVQSVKKGFAALVKRAGLADVTFHDLRRTVASQGLRRGHSFSRVAALLGDDERVVREHYAHVSPIFLAEVMPSLERSEEV